MRARCLSKVNLSLQDWIKFELFTKLIHRQRDAARPTTIHGKQLTLFPRIYPGRLFRSFGHRSETQLRLSLQPGIGVKMRREA
jgi:hypothetical protein